MPQVNDFLKSHLHQLIKWLASTLEIHTKKFFQCFGYVVQVRFFQPWVCSNPKRLVHYYVRVGKLPADALLLM
jgi:hypothetical protein